MKGTMKQAQALELSELGFNANQIAVELDINYRTAQAMIEESANKNKRKPRRKKSPVSDIYKPLVLEQLLISDKFSAKQVYDNIKKDRYLKEQEMTASFSTIRRLVNIVRIEEKIPKPRAHEKSKRRMYQGVPELPPGKQAQFDFGEMYVDCKNGEQIKLYWGILLLSYSRYRYVEFQLEPVKAGDAIRMLDNGFEYFEGIPKEIVIDQDSVMVSEEKRGEIKLTNEFDTYCKRMPFHLHVLHKSDPESKGKVERSMSYIENNLLNGYVYTSFEDLQADAKYWIDHIANAEINQTTKQAPAERMILEKRDLQPIPNSVATYKEIITHQVNKDNTVWYKGSRYEVPKGTYLEGLKIKASIYVYSDHIEIFEVQTGNFLASYKLEENTEGHFYTLDNRTTNNEGKIRELKQKALETLEFYKDADLLIKKIAESSPDFIVDQMKYLIETVKDWRIQEKLLNYVFDLGLRLDYLTVDVIKDMIMTEIKKFDLDPNKSTDREAKNQRWEKISKIAQNESPNYIFISEKDYSKEYYE